jgi:S-adenosylmethionine:tRNA ribosyltransferase-isomerase
VRHAVAALQAPTTPAHRLLHVDPLTGELADRSLEALPALLRPGELLVVNDAATLPASLAATAPDGNAMEVRLAGEAGDGLWRCVLLGSGDWRTPTESRPPPPLLEPGAVVRFASDFSATVERIAAVSPRLVWMRFSPSGERFWRALYRHGRPVQYAYEQLPLSLDRVQTPYAARPWSSEMPSAGRGLTLPLLRRLRSRGVGLAALTHAAGLSSTGDGALDAALPLPERFEIPEATVDELDATRRARGRVVAVGTTVVRALEGSAAAHGGRVQPGADSTPLILGPGHRRAVVDGLLSGIHARDSSHYGLLRAFLPPPLDTHYLLHVAAGGYRGHEFGDSTLILPAR